MKYFIVLLACVSLAFAAPIDEELLGEWNQYKLAYSKSYATQEEDDMRLELYLKTKEIVEAHNFRYKKGEVSFDIELNRFADWLPEEIQGLLALKPSNTELNFGGEIYNTTAGEDVPDSVNWIDKGAVTSVKDQESCGSCYAFSTVGSLEGQTFLKTKKLVSLSPQNIVDCSTEFGNDGCDGGLMTNSFNYVVNNGGIDTEKSYPYSGSDEDCSYSPDNNGATCRGYMTIDTEDKLLHAVAQVGPISVAIAVDPPFMLYQKGVYDSDNCTDVCHGVLVVGYNKKPTGEDKYPYWLVKNSWGTQFGEKGYIKMRMFKNLCMIGNEGSYPFV